MEVRSASVLLCLALCSLTWALAPQDVPHSRQKRILWVTNDGRLALPPGTSLVLAPSLSMPFIRNPPEGFFSNITVSLPFTGTKIKFTFEFKSWYSFDLIIVELMCVLITNFFFIEIITLTVDFDKLGLTDNENPYGTFPPLFSRSFGRAAGGVLANFVGHYLDKRRGKRSNEKSEIPPHAEKKILDHFHGGERALLFGAVEDMLTNFGLSGKACLLRAICEVHAHPMYNYGLLGEMLKLFFTASKSPYSEFLKEYVDAEKAGTGDGDGPGECWPYYKDCPKSLFLPRKNKYAENAEEDHQSEEEENEIDSEIPEATKVTLSKDMRKFDFQPM